jgi:hypothetical protein
VAYLGAQPNKTLTKTTSQSFNGTGSATVFTLNRAVNTGEELEVFVENVQQEPGSGKSYTASGTTLTFDEAPPSGTGNIYVIYRGQAEVTTRLEHDANAALAATTGAFSGNVGIGTANPTNFGGTTLQTNHGSTYSANLVSSGAYILQMIASATHGAMSMGARSNHHVAFTTNDTERMRITSGGAVGIGTSSPSQALEISGSAPIIRLTDTGASNNYSEINADYTSGSLQISADTANASSNSRIIFAVDNTERMRIDSSGNLGIGTLSPSGLLDVHSASGDANMLITTGTTNASTTLMFGDSDSTNIGRVQYDHSNNSMRFNTAGTERMRLTSGGDVGIGTSSPNNNSGRTTLTINNASQGGAIDLEHNGTVVGKFICDGSNTLGIQADGNRDILFKTNGNSRMLLSGSGEALIGTTSGGSSTRLNLTGGASGSSICSIKNEDANGGTFQTSIHFRNSSNATVGTIKVNNSETAYNSSSDYRLKENVADMTGAIARVKQLLPKRFNFIINADRTVDGFLAHEAQTVVPEAVSGTHNEVETWTQQEIDDGDAPDGTSAGDNKLDGDGKTIPVMQGIDQSKLVPLLTAALKESIAKIEALEARVTTLEGN